MNQFARAPSKVAGCFQKLLYADRSVVVINKPPGVVCQSNKNSASGTNGFDVLLKEIQSRLGLPAPPIQVHRLDKLSTGALLLATTDASARELARQFKGRAVKKTYLAVVRGGRKSFNGAERGTIDAGLRVGEGRVHVDTKDGQLALTDWELLGCSVSLFPQIRDGLLFAFVRCGSFRLKESVPLSLLRLTLLTGVKNQLRVHLADVMKCPILGDPLYSQTTPSLEVLNVIPKHVSVFATRSRSSRGGSNDRTTESSSGSPVVQQRMFLHSSRCAFYRYRKDGPHKRLLLGVTAPLHKDFVEVCDAAGLRKFVPETLISGGLDVDGEVVPIEEEVDGLGGRWIA